MIVYSQHTKVCVYVYMCVLMCVCVCVCVQLTHHCDMVIVDGGHDYDTAWADLVSMRKLARKRFHIFV